MLFCGPAVLRLVFARAIADGTDVLTIRSLANAVASGAFTFLFQFLGFFSFLFVAKVISLWTRAFSAVYSLLYTILNDAAYQDIT